MSVQTERGDHTEPHLFLAKNGANDDVLFWGTGPDDRYCAELDLALERMSIAPRKALWDVILGSPLVEDCTDWRPEVSA